MKTLAPTLLLTGLALLQPIHASAFSTTGATWGGSGTTLSLNSTSFPSGNAFTTHAIGAATDWNAVTGSGFAFAVNSSNCGRSISPFSDNCVMFVNSSDLNGALGVTSRVSFAGNMIDADIRFARDFSWVAGLNVGQFSFGNPFSFRGVARHEFGHVLGLCHEDRRDNVVLMNSRYTAGSILPANPHWDDRNGARSLYAVGGTERDLIAYMWKKTSNDVPGCRSSGTVASPVRNVTNRAEPGGPVVMEFSIENAGNISVPAFEVDFLLSTDTTITPADALIGRISGASAPPHSRGTFQRTLTLPSGTPLGSYSLGICLDSSNSVTEGREFNNCRLAPGTLDVLANVPPPPPPPARLRVIRFGSGSGSVTSAPSGINCGSDCSQTYANGTVVQLNETANPGSVAGVFVGGDPDCYDGEVTMDRDKTCRVFFDDAFL